MAIDPDALLARRFAPVAQRYTRKDAILYALGLGFGTDPVNPGQLHFVYEDGLTAVPTLANVLGYAGFWAREPDTGIDWRRLLHAEQSFVLHRPLAPEGEIVGHTRVAAIYDKGADKGAFLSQERRIVEAATGELIATVTQLSLLRGDGGRGGSHGAPPPPHPIPEREPDAVCNLEIPSQAALIYRLSGDLNPLHADPAVARAGGFARPILHGLCTMGVACHAALSACLAYDARAITGMRVRFTAPVFPGETLRTELWRDGNVIAFRSCVPAREVTVLNAGRIDLAPSPPNTSGDGRWISV